MIERTMTLKKFFKAACFLLLLSVVTGGCNRECLPENKDAEATIVNFILNHRIPDLDTDTEFVPMRRVGAYKNFIQFNAEFAIYRKIAGKYILQSYEYVKPGEIGYPENGKSITSATLFSLTDLGLNKSYTLQPGEYRACIGVNMPYYAASFQYPETGEEVSSIIQTPDVFLVDNPIRDVFFTYQDFVVKKTSQLETGNEATVSFAKPLQRKASPVRFILINKIGDSGKFEIQCRIESLENSMPGGIDIDGNAVGEGESDKMRMVNLPVELKDENSGITYCFPSYCSSAEDATSVFVPCTDAPVKLKLVINDLRLDGASLKINGVDISDVWVRPNEITNVVLLLDEKGDLHHIPDEQKLADIKKKWEDQHPETPFDYIEYNY